MPVPAPARGALLCVLLWSSTAQAQDDHRMWGRVETTAGTYEGFIRWDRNEASWVDQLDGMKVVPDPVYEAWRAAWDAGDRPVRTVELQGYRISWNEEDPDFPGSADSGVRFGHVARIEVVGPDEVAVTLKSGARGVMTGGESDSTRSWTASGSRVVMTGGGTDIGRGMRGVTVVPEDGQEITLAWEQRSVEVGRGYQRGGVVAVEFAPVPPESRAPSPRLYGTVEPRDGPAFTGYLAWDLDEVLESDVLDGLEDGRDREIPFSEIRRIDRHLGGANVTLRSGRTLYLRGTNDVGDGHRGVQVSDPDLGMIQVSWDALAGVSFETPPSAGPGYDDFDGGRALFGTVRTRRGNEIRGYLRWNAHKEQTWEPLVGRLGDVLLHIELGLVDRIRRGDLSGATVDLVDGRSFELDGTAEVSWDSFGVFVAAADGEPGARGGWRLVTWDELAEVRFEGVPTADTVEARSGVGPGR